VKEDAMAKLPFDGYDTMTKAEVRQAMAERLSEALNGFRDTVQDAVDFEKATGKHGDLIDQLKLELARLKTEIDEGTNRWGGLDNG
jgi:hypothetical protein